ncbi:MAG: hypothetical protein IT177_24250 [Acidobacteria bacterium]|nr:hypothetical protein [Acidobacteriota bacterium]
MHGTYAKVLGALGQLVGIAAITAMLLEGLVAFSFSYPTVSPLPLSLTRYLHMRFDRHVIQMMPQCAQYDEAVTYTLKPGRCTFSNREFSNEYVINSAGLRDDEDSLIKPDTVMLGDSLTMGWGVDQDQTFPSLFEKLTGRRTLNAGVSSYGTVRELRLMERLDRSRITNVVIQYSDNDITENLRFVEGTFSTLSLEEYESTVEVHRRDLAYFPGKYTFNVLVQLSGSLRGSPRAAQPDGATVAGVKRQAEVFVGVLERSPIALNDVGVTVLSLDSGFIEAVRQLTIKSPTPWVRSIQFADLGRLAEVDGAFYVLDDHPRAIGHATIARELARLLGPSR